MTNRLYRIYLVGRFISAALKSRRLRDCYNACAWMYDDIFADNQNQYSEIIVDYLSGVDRASSRAVDLGSGTGILTGKLARICSHVIGVDFSIDMLRRAPQMDRKVPEVSSVAGDIFALPFSDNRFDIVTCLGTITHILPKDFHGFVSEIDRVSKPNSDVLVAMTPLPWRLFAARKGSFSPGVIDWPMIHLYNFFQALSGMTERRGAHSVETFVDAFEPFGYTVRCHEVDSLIMIHARRT